MPWKKSTNVRISALLHVSLHFLDKLIKISKNDHISTQGKWKCLWDISLCYYKREDHSMCMHERDRLRKGRTIFSICMHKTNVTHTKYIPCTRYRLSTILSKTVILDPLVPTHHSGVIYSFLHNKYLENQPYSCSQKTSLYCFFLNIFCLF